MDPYTYNGRSFDTELLILRSLFALNPDTNLPISTNYVLTTDGIGGLVWLDPFVNLSTAGPGVGYLPSTLFTLTSNLSTVSSMTSSLQIGLSTLSTVLGQAYISSGVYNFQLNSTIEGLATYGYVSSTQLTSTVAGLGTAGFVSSPQLISTVAWFQDSSRYVSTGNLVSTTAAFIANPSFQSTVTGLGSAGYISSLSFYSTLNTISTLNTSSLVSTVVGLATYGYVSTSQLVSSISGLGTAGYISSLSLTSTTVGLGSIGYVSSSQLASTVGWLTDPSRYVSTGALVSTAAGISTNLQTAFYIDRSGTLVINGGTIIVSSASSVAFLSSFQCSSITYQGAQGEVQAVVYPNVTAGPNMFFSSAIVRFDQFSSYITANSALTLDIYPTFVFSPLNTGASNFFVTPMSTILAYGNTFLKSQVTSWVFANNKNANYGNLYQQPMKMEIAGSNIFNNYASSYVLCHNLPSSLTSNLTPGFTSNNVSIYYGSTNSLFLTIQNIYS